MSTTKLPDKLPDENLAYTFDYTKQMATGDKITGKVVVLKSGDVAVGLTSYTDTTVTFRLSGGTIGTLCELWVEATTQGGETIGELVLVRIVG